MEVAVGPAVETVDGTQRRIEPGHPRSLHFITERK